jgi:3',5'-cyclic AMP phosphodiesterase CpdA
VKLGWISDVHLNFPDGETRRRFYEEMQAYGVDMWLVSGDIGEAPSVLGYLDELANWVSTPLFFVLGNHDFYRGSIRRVVSEVASRAPDWRGVHWLTQSEGALVGETLAIVGDDGWADARLGDPMGTTVELNDFYLIEELTGHSREELVSRLNTLGDKAASRLGAKLEAAAKRVEHVVVVTHVPPFEGATWHEGGVSSPEWLPWFSCDAMGRAILECADRYPRTEFLVLCGHTHSPGRYSPRANLVVHTAAATYGKPAVQAVLEFRTGVAEPRVA